MSLDLSTLKFSVETSELELAVKKIEALGDSVEGLATSIKKLDKEATDANKTQSQTNLNNAKTEALNIKNAKGLRDAAAATGELTEATKKKQSVEERQAAITRNMADGYSRGQASILATAEAAGEATDRIGELLKTQRAMQGVSPFDRSLGAATVFANELRVLTVANDLYNKDLGFTKNQLMELGREHVRMTEQFKIQGKSLAGLDTEFNKVVQSAKLVTQSENAMATSMKNADKATVDAGKANAYIENELQKVRFALQANNEELNRSTSNSLVRFENALKKSGLTLDQQRVKIDEYRKAQIELQKTQKANQTDYITRAVGPQITDIIVGLSTGQSPLTVMMQQGGQLRDQFGMMGIAAADMATVMRTAMSSMAKSVFDTGKAIGGMLVGGIFDAGKAVTNFGMEITGLNAKFDELKRGYAALGTEGFSKINNLMKIQSVVAGIVAVSLAAIVVQVIAWAIATKQIIEEEGKLSKALNLTGASLGLTKDSAVALASSMKDVGATTSQGIEVITAMAKTGIIGAESIRMVTEAAVLMERYAGVAIEDTVKAFEKMKEKPVESMVELAKATGTVTPETIRLIYELESQGRTAEAASIAMKALADANSSAAKRIQEDLHPLQKLYMGIGDGIRYMWNGFKDVARLDFSGDLDAAYLRLKIAQMSPIVNATAIETERTLISQLSAKIRLEGEGVRLRQEQAKASADTAKWEDIKLKYLNSEKKEATEIAKIRKAGADAGILEAEIQQQVNAVIAKRPKASEAKESELQKAINKAKEDFIDIQNKVNGVNKEFNNKLEGQQLLLKEGVINIEQYKDVVIALIQQQKFYTDGLAQEEKQLRLVQKAWEDTNKAQAKKDEESFKAYDALKAQSVELKNATSEIEFQLGLVGKSEEQQKNLTREHKTQNDLREVQVELEKELVKIRDQKQDPGIQSMLEQVEREKAAEKIKAINAGVALQAAQDMMKEFDAIKSSITDVITTALFDGGKAGSKKLRDQVVQAFRNKITVVIDAVVNTALSSLMGGSGGSTGGVGGGSSTGGILGAISTGKSFVDALSGSMNTAIATSFGKFASTGMGQSLGLSTSVGVHGPVTAAGASPTMLTSTGTMLQGAMASAAGIAAGLALNKAISGGYSVGKGMDNWQKVGTVIAGAINPALGAIVGAIGGLVNRAFGRKLTETGIQGTFGGEAGFSGQGYTFEKGGWFRSDKTKTQEIDPALQSGLAQQFNLIKTSVGFMASMLGQGTDAIDSFTASIKVNFKDLSEEEATKLLQEEFNKVSESLAGLALGTTQYNRTGETNVETLTRLHTSLLTANSALSVLGGYLFDISLVGADASQKLVDLMGGVQQFTSTMGEYYQNFYTEEERTTRSTADLVSSFAALNIEMPAINESTREWYRSEVEKLGAMDLSVEANARAYASILGLQGAVNTLAPSFDDVANSVTEAMNQMLESARNASSVAVQLGLTTSYQVAQETANAAWSAFKTALPQASGFTEAEIVNFARSPDQMKLLSESDQKTVNTFVGAIGDWNSAQQAEQSRAGSSYTNQPFQSSDTTVQTISKVLGAFDLLNASLALQATLAEASGDLIQAENVQSQQRAIILAGLNEQDPTGLLSSLQIAIYSLGDAAKQTAKDVALASTRMSWQDKVNAITQDPVALAASRAYAKQRDLAGTDDPFTKALIELSYQYEDDVAARKKQTDLMALQDEAMQNYLNAQTNVLNAQKEYASVLKGTIESMKDFLSTLNGASTPLESTAKAREAFGGLAKRASTGDTSVYSELAPAARVFLDLSKSYSRTIQDYRRDEAAVRRTMNSVIRVNTAELAKLPSEVSAVSDPTKEALNALRVAQEEQTRAGTMVAAMSVNQAESLARLNGSTDSLTSRYLELIATLPNGDALKTEFDTVMDKAVTDKLPEENPFTFEDVFRGVITDVVPEGFFGNPFSVESLFREATAALFASINSPNVSSKAPVTPIGTSYAGMGSDIKTIQDLYSVNLGREGDVAGMEFWTKAFMGDGVISAEERQLFAISAMPEYLSKLPTFAVGTNSVPTDMLANIHAGERIIPAADNTELMQRLSSPQGDNTELLGQLIMLNSRVKSLETSMIAGQVAIADNTRKTKNVLEKFDIDGLPKERV